MNLGRRRSDKFTPGMKVQNFLVQSESASRVSVDEEIPEEERNARIVQQAALLQIPVSHLRSVLAGETVFGDLT